MKFSPPLRGSSPARNETVLSNFDLFDDLSFGSCSPGQQTLTANCLPALWLCGFIAITLALLGFAMICATKLIRTHLLSKGTEDDYFHRFGFLHQRKGGCIEAGTSSIRWCEQYIDIEQRALLYSPTPHAAGSGMNGLRQTVVFEASDYAGAEVEAVKIEEDTKVLAIPPDWFRKLKRYHRDDGSMHAANSSMPMSENDTPPPYAIHQPRFNLENGHHNYSSTKSERGRRASLP